MLSRRASVTVVPEPTYGPWQPTQEHFESIRDLLERQNKLLRRVVQQLEAQALRPEVDLDVYVNVSPISLSRNNRRVTRMWVANGVSCLISNLHGGFAPFQLQAGWNYLDVVEGAQIMTQSGPGFAALWQCLDTVTTGATL